MELDRLRLPPRDMEIGFDELDLDQYLFVEGEESLKNRLEIPGLEPFCWLLFTRSQTKQP